MTFSGHVCFQTINLSHDTLVLASAFALDEPRETPCQYLVPVLSRKSEREREKERKRKREGRRKPRKGGMEGGSEIEREREICLLIFK